jgi:uncharacterized protein
VSRVFLTAEWRNLAMLNYAVDPALLRPFVPRGTELDAWEGRTYVSLVGFLFANTRVLGIPIPFHTTFEEVNLRFYVRRTVDGEVRRAVTFLRELVPRSAIAFVARLAYNEPYIALPMRHFPTLPTLPTLTSFVRDDDDSLPSLVRDDNDSLPSLVRDDDDSLPSYVHYGWKVASGWCGLSVQPRSPTRHIIEGSQEEFITEHYWGYTRQRDGSTVEYRVEHPKWRVCSVDAPKVTGHLADLYGSEFARILAQPPHSAFFAAGSAVTVYAPNRIG